MIVRNIVKKVNLVFTQHQCSCDGVNGSIAPPLVKEAAISVQICKVIDVGL